MTRTESTSPRGVDLGKAERAGAAGGRGRWVVVVCLGLVLAGLGAQAWAAKDDLDLVSRAAGAAGAKGNGVSFDPTVSADGRFVAFSSFASNLHPDDGDANSDVFVRDLQANATTLVSRAAGAAGAKGNADSFGQVAISADGRSVAFESFASNLHPDDPDGFGDVFVRDLQANTTTLVSRAAGPTGAKGNGFSSAPAVSADGRSVAFHSGASNLHPNDGDGNPDVFVRDLQANTTTLVSRAAGPTGAKGNSDSFEPEISADGRFVAFESFASNLHPDDGDGTIDVFVRALEANTTTLVSRAGGVAGAKGNGDSFELAVSADGRSVAFTSASSNLHPDDGDGELDVFVRDLQANTTTLVSRAAGAAGAKGDGPSFEPAVSADGRFVAFGSFASNLHPDDGDGTIDVFVRDLQANTTTLVSRAAGAAGPKGNALSRTPAVSADGRFVAFRSDASNLHPDDGDTTPDVFRRDVLGPPPAQPPPAQPPPAQPPAGAALQTRPGCPFAGNLIVGTSGDDERSGGALTDIVLGRAGDDLLRGLGGADCLFGQRGADRLLGGVGGDRLFGGPGADRLLGGVGGDRLSAGRGRDRLRGGRGSDRISPGSGRDRIAAGPGNDRVRARGAARDTIDCGPGRLDVAIVDRLDATRDCERVRVR